MKAHGLRTTPAGVATALSGWMNFRDDPPHQRLREPVRAAFTPLAAAEVKRPPRSLAY